MVRPTPATSIVHGTVNAYRSRHCRCTHCRAAHTENHRAWRATKAPADAPHGTSGGYDNYKCRCDDCRVAHNARIAAGRARRAAARAAAVVAFAAVYLTLAEAGAVFLYGGVR